VSASICIVVQTMSSKEIAELTGKNHADVLRDIRKMQADLELGESTFAGTYLDVQSKERDKVVFTQNFPSMNGAHTVDGIHATSRRNTSGLSSAILSKVCAALEGERAPCSHACTVLGDTPNKAANAAWLIPALLRVAATAESGTTVVRAARPAFISFTDCIKLAWNCSSSLSIFHLLSELVQKFSGQVIKLGFGVDNQQPQMTVCGLAVVDNTRPAAFPHAITPPSHFTQAACTLDNIARQGIVSQPSNKAFSFVIAPNIGGATNKHIGFNHSHHGLSVLQRSTHLQAASVRLGVASVLNSLDASHKLAYIGRAALTSAVGIGLPFNTADKPLPSGIFISINTIAASFMAGHCGGSSGCAGSRVTGSPTLLWPATFDWTRSGGLLKPNTEAFTMPKLARTLLSYSTVILLTLAFERGASVAVILATLGAFVLVHAIGGASHE
jgi:hypothetical protein